MRTMYIYTRHRVAINKLKQASPASPLKYERGWLAAVIQLSYFVFRSRNNLSLCCLEARVKPQLDLV
jgi:hypothetical protein